MPAPAHETGSSMLAADASQLLRHSIELGPLGPESGVPYAYAP